MEGEADDVFLTDTLGPKEAHGFWEEGAMPHHEAGRRNFGKCTAALSFHSCALCCLIE